MQDYKLLTIGYEGRDIEEFVSRLKRHRVDRLIDIREIPASRKKGFSKNALKDRLEGEGMEYVHIRELGSPRKIRNKLREDWNYDYFFRKFDEYLAGNSHLIEQVYTFLSTGVNCLMCFEREPNKCHRQSVAREIKVRDGNGLLIQHI